MMRSTFPCLGHLGIPTRGIPFDPHLGIPIPGTPAYVVLVLSV